MLSLPNIRIIGLTGMSGAGKSTVSRFFGENNYTVIDCDLVAREVAAPNSLFLSELNREFAFGLINEDGSLNRTKTANLIFSDTTMRNKYNNLIYPYIIYSIIHKLKKSDKDVLLDAPTLFEASLDSICTEIISVIADRETCIKRIIQRDGISEELAVARISSQHDVAFFRSRSDYCIENNGTEDELSLKLQDILAHLKG